MNGEWMIECVNDMIFCENKNMFHKTKGGCVTALLVHMDNFTIRWSLEDVICLRKGIQVSQLLEKCIDFYEIPGFPASSAVY